MPELNPGSRETVLVIEEDGALRHLFCSLLSKWGFAPISVSCHREAAAVAGNWNDVRLVIADVDSSDADGLGDARELRRRFPHAPLAVTAGWLDHNERAGLYREGITFWLKPFAIAQLRSDISRLMCQADCGEKEQP